MSTKNQQYYLNLDRLSPSNLLINRHIGPSSSERSQMLSEIGFLSLEDLIEKTLPKTLPRNNLPSWKTKTEEEVIQELKILANENLQHKNFLGGGFYGTYTPNVILRNVMQNPA